MQQTLPIHVSLRFYMEKFTFWLRQARLVLIVSTIWIILDQVTKEIVRQTVPLYDSVRPIAALGDYIVIEHVNNYGAAFGILQNQSTLFVVIALVVISAILLYVRYLPPEQRFVRVLLGLQLGGAVGNLLDRLMQGYVTDFLKMGVPGIYYWPNYNVADSGIVIGVIGLGIYILLEDFRAQRQAAQVSTETT